MRTLVFNVSLFDSLASYGHLLSSHEEYARRQGYDYQSIQVPPAGVTTRADAAWSKLHHLASALMTYERVLLLDTDCLVQATCPALGILPDGFALHMAKGRSGRFNSGVIIAFPQAIDLLQRIIRSRGDSLPEEDSKGLKYENANVIHHCKNHPGVAELDQRWNNTSDPELEDFIRHYTGPMRRYLGTDPPFRGDTFRELR